MGGSSGRPFRICSQLFSCIFKPSEVSARQNATTEAAAMARDDDDHRGIPRDTNGDPIFLILPPGVKASYDELMAGCEAGWRATGNPAFIKEAMILVHLHRQPPPLWLSEAVCTLADNRRAKGH